ncbi:MAG: AMP-binding protein [Candidatus Kuenenia sp.]|nr:AMP-binding protein [Candidatus Kuenenia hertensis]
MILKSFITTAKRNFNKPVYFDSFGSSLTFGHTLTGSILLAKHIRNLEGENIAVVFPPSLGGALANVATAFAGKAPVCLNFVAGKEEQKYVLKMCDVQSILTSKIFIEKAGIPHDKRMVFIEDIKNKISKKKKSLTYLACKFRSKNSLIQEFSDYDLPDKNAVILFTSGSESTPKGVPLTNQNVHAAIQNFSTIFDPIPEDIFLGAMPFFHVFGFVVCLWLPLLMGLGVVFHPNPTEYEKLGRIVHEKKVTIVLGTSTLYRGFIKKWQKEQTSSIRLAYAGAEKLNDAVREKFYEKFGIPIYEAYGMTESSASISANKANDFRHGSVGKLLPGINGKIVDAETYEELPSGKEGLILLQGPNFMKGYYKSPELTEKAFHQGYYITGDIGKFNDGFLYITDRQKRFAKIGGEMVPLSPIENKLTHVLDEKTEEEKRNCAVVNIPHAQKGEQLVAFIVYPNPDKLSLNSSLDKLGLTKLSQPDHYVCIDSIPLLSTGKVDYNKLKQLALQQYT